MIAEHKEIIIHVEYDPNDAPTNPDVGVAVDAVSDVIAETVDSRTIQADLRYCKMKKYKCIVADPPWNVHKTGKRKSRPNQSTELDYATMITEEIINLPIQNLVDDNSVLFLWTIHSHIQSAFDVMNKWGFKYQRLLTWDKGNGMCLFGFHHRTEFCLFGYKGKLEAFPRQKAFPTLFIGKSNKHSQKPEEFFKLVES